jgi:hypothetical protein
LRCHLQRYFNCLARQSLLLTAVRYDSKEQEQEQYQNKLTGEQNMNNNLIETSTMNKNENINALSKLLSRIASKLDKPPITCGDWVLAIIIEAKFGLTSDALRDYRRTIWAEGVHWQKNPKGRVVYNVNEVNKWMAT